MTEDEYVTVHRGDLLVLWTWAVEGIAKQSPDYWASRPVSEEKIRAALMRVHQSMGLPPMAVPLRFVPRMPKGHAN